MEKSRKEEKNKKFTSTLKNKMFRGYEKVRNKFHNNNLDLNDNFQRFSYDNSNLYLNDLDKKYSYSNEKLEMKDKFVKTNNFNSLNNINIQHLSKIKKDDYNNILNKLFFTTSNIINKNYLKNKKPSLNLRNFNYNKKDSSNDIKEKNKILNKLFPDIDEINKYSNLPFFSLIKVKSPYKLKLNSNNKKEIKKNFAQEEFLYKISHNYNDEDEKINYNFIKNKGIKKGRTNNYFHGINKFCINNKISETNFIREEDINKKNEKLELDIANLTKGGEKTSQLSTKEKHIKILENNLKNLKFIPNQIINDLEDDVFKFIDEEFDDNNNITDNSKNIIKKERKMLNSLNDKENKSNIINLNTQFKMNKASTTNNKYFHSTSNEFKNRNNSSYNNINEFNYTGFKKPQQYPINFYSTQQIKIKEHFNDTYKNTFDERKKRMKKGNKSERTSKKRIDGKIIENININNLHKKKIITSECAFKKECKIRDIIIGNKLKCEFNRSDIKRILNGLKPYADIKIDDKEIINNLDNIKDNTDSKVGQIKI